MEIVNRLQGYVLSLWHYFLSLSLTLEILIVFGIGLFIDYLIRYCIRGISLWVKLKKSIKDVENTKKYPLEQKKDKIGEILPLQSQLGHAWNEFQATIHPTRHKDESYEDLWATVPAESFFNLETIIDPRIASEYFRHLPGIFTGLGIIGTFSGLIEGLKTFHPELQQQEAIQKGLANLFVHIEHAFMFSATAIVLAMIVTFTEKLIYAGCAKGLVKLTAALDHHFRYGIGETYLSRLVKSAEQTSTQTRQLKESLVNDLKSMLDNMTTQLGQTIAQSFQTPMQTLNDIVAKASGEQATAATKTMQTIADDFMGRLDKTFSAQMHQAAQSMTELVTSMNQVIDNMGHTSQACTTSMTQTLCDLMDQTNRQQQSLATRQDTAMTSMTTRVEEAMQSMANRQETLHDRTAHSMTTFTDAMQKQINDLAASHHQMTQSMGEMSNQTIMGLQDGARAIDQALESVVAALEQYRNLATTMASLGPALNASAQAIATR